MASAVVGNGVAEDPLFSEIRHMAPSHVQKIGQILQVESEWKRVMGAVVSERDPAKFRFSSDDIRIIEDYSRTCGKTAFEVLVDEWGTMGKRRPTVGKLMLLCLEVGAIRAASYLSEAILKRETLTESDVESEKSRISEELRRSAAARAARDFPDLERQLESDMLENNAAAFPEAGDGVDAYPEENSDVLSLPVPHENAFNVPNIPYRYLSSITCAFGADDPSRKIGSGGFADVYLGITHRSAKRLAIKRLKEVTADKERQDQLFNYEVGEASQLKNRFIIEILGYCNEGGQCPCLVYPFMQNGTLETRLRLEGESSKRLPLDSTSRLRVVRGVAEALDYLHSRQKPLIHRDIKSSNILLDEHLLPKKAVADTYIKSSNILLDEHLLPKVADFGLLRYASKGDTQTINVKGTPHYMSPDAMRGDITAKVDVYSFGAVMLDVLTGLKPIDPDRENRDLISHVQEELCVDDDETVGMRRLLDPKAMWDESVAVPMFKLALDCLKDKRDRPDSRAVRMRLTALAGQQEI